MAFHSTSNEGIWPKTFSNFMQGLKSAILAFFRMGRDGCALLVRASRIPHRNFKNLFVLGPKFYEQIRGLSGENNSLGTNISSSPLFIQFRHFMIDCLHKASFVSNLSLVILDFPLECRKQRGPVGGRGQGGPDPPPPQDFGRSVNPISTRVVRLCLPH